MTHPPPADRKIITDPATLKVLADPLRLQILRALEVPDTVKAVADSLDWPPTKLYYHVNMLEKHGLLQIVDSHVVSGIVEKVYQVTARSFELGREVMGEADLSDERLEEVLALVFDGPKAEVREAIRRGVIQAPGTAAQPDAVFFRTSMMLTPAQVAFVTGRLDEFLGAMKDSLPDAEGGSGQPYSMTLAFYPVAPPSSATD